MINSGISVTTGGNSIDAIHNPKTNFLPLNLSLANEYAHSIAVAVPSVIAGTTMIKVLRRYVR